MEHRGLISFRHRHSHVSRWTATALTWRDGFFDAVVTDPPYYDNVPYADIADYFYVWLKRTVGEHSSEHFATQLTPKKTEATALASRHSGNMHRATIEYNHKCLEHSVKPVESSKPMERSLLYTRTRRPSVGPR